MRTKDHDNYTRDGRSKREEKRKLKSDEWFANNRTQMFPQVVGYRHVFDGVLKYTDF